MTSPATADLSATSPSALLGDPSAAQPPQIGVGSRGKGAGRSLGRLKSIGGDLSKRGPRAPLSPQQREEGRQRLQPVRAQPAPAPRPAPRDDRERTAAGAPVDTPRRIPKTGRTEAYRDAMTRILGKDEKPKYHAMPAESQEVVNRIMRHTGRVSMKNYDLAGRQALQDDFDIMRGKRPRSKVAEAAARGEGRSPMEKAFDEMGERDAEREKHAPSEDPETRAAREAINLHGLGSVGKRGEKQPRVVDEFPTGRHMLTIEEGDELLKRAREKNEQP